MESVGFEARSGQESRAGGGFRERRPGPRVPRRRDYAGEAVPSQGYLLGGSAHPSGPMPAVPPHAPARPQPPGRSRHAAASPWGQQAPGPDTRTYPAWEEQVPRGDRTRRRTARSAPEDQLARASRVLSAADYEAAAITQQASYRAAMIARQVAHEAVWIREAAELEASEILQQASVRAAVVREAAEMEAAEILRSAMLMRAEVREAAARLRDTLPSPVLPPVPPTGYPSGPQARLRTAPVARPARTGTASPAPRPGTRPAGRHGARPARKPAAGQGRQKVAMRFAVAMTSALFLAAVCAGAAEIYLHGFDFFVFRSVGTGETGRGPGGLQENQGPGQPGAATPAASHGTGKPSSHGTAAAHSGQ